MMNLLSIKTIIGMFLYCCPTLTFGLTFMAKYPIKNEYQIAYQRDGFPTVLVYKEANCKSDKAPFELVNYQRVKMLDEEGDYFKVENENNQTGYAAKANFNPTAIAYQRDGQPTVPVYEKPGTHYKRKGFIPNYYDRVKLVNEKTEFYQVQYYAINEGKTIDGWAEKVNFNPTAIPYQRDGYPDVLVYRWPGTQYPKSVDPKISNYKPVRVVGDSQGFFSVQYEDDEGTEYEGWAAKENFHPTVIAKNIREGFHQEVLVYRDAINTRESSNVAFKIPANALVKVLSQLHSSDDEKVDLYHLEYNGQRGYAPVVNFYTKKAIVKSTN